VQAERALRRLEGVATVRVTLREKTARVTLKTDAVFEPEKFRAAIKSASQQVRAFELRLLAAVEQRDGQYYLRRSSVGQRFLVHAGGALTAKLGGFAGKQVRATGRLVSSSSPLELQLTEIAPP